MAATIRNRRDKATAIRLLIATSRALEVNLLVGTERQQVRIRDLWARAELQCK
jgi:hypothetical protein